MDINQTPFGMSGRAVLVTGASSGLGRAIAVACSQMGATVILTARNEDRLKETMAMLTGEGHSYICADLCDQEQLEQLVDKLPQLQGACLCAGIGVAVTVAYASKKKFDKLFQTNFFAQTELSRLLVKNKLLRRGSSIVFMSSVGGVTKFNYAHAVYGTAKAALKSWSNFMAYELGPKGIRSNCICPGMIDTPLIHNGAISEEQLEADSRQYPLQRYGRPEEVANAAVFLLSEASAWITGTSIFVDGGYSVKP